MTRLTKKEIEGRLATLNGRMAERNSHVRPLELNCAYGGYMITYETKRGSRIAVGPRGTLKDMERTIIGMHAALDVQGWATEDEFDAKAGN